MPGLCLWQEADNDMDGATVCGRLGDSWPEADVE